MNQQQAEALAARINSDFDTMSAYVFYAAASDTWQVAADGMGDFASVGEYTRWFHMMEREGDGYHMGRQAAG